MNESNKPPGRIAGRIATAAALAIALVQATYGESRPNILWLSCEDISPHLGCYGAPHAVTPHLDRLAAAGTLFTHAFSTAGVCAPSRSAIITGIYQTTLGTQHMRCKARLPDHVQPFPRSLRQSGYYCTNHSKTDYQFEPPDGTWDESSKGAHWRNRPDPKQPFFAVFNYGGCHESGIANTAKYRSVTHGLQPHDRDVVAATLPPYYPDTPVTREDWGRYYDVITAMDRWVGDMLRELDEDGLSDNTIVFFWSDHGVGLPRAKRWLYDSGIHVPLIVHVPPKFRGLTAIEPGTTDDRLISLIDLGPSVLRLAGLPVPAHMQGRAFLGPDRPAARQYVFAARDRMDERYDIIRAVRDQRFKYIRNYQPLKPYYQYMNTPEKGATMRELRRLATTNGMPPAAARWMAASKPPEELYDTDRDPHELTNLAGSARHADLLERMRNAHLEWARETRDLGLVPEAELAGREQRLGTRYAILRQPGASERMRRIVDTATLNAPGPAAVEQWLDASRDDDATVRYWAAAGIGNLGRDAAAAAGRMRELLEDESPSVAIAAARALCRMGRPDQAVAVLVKHLEGDPQWARLEAANVLDEIDELARPAEDSLHAALRPRTNLQYRGKYVVRVINRALNELNGTEKSVP